MRPTIKRNRRHFVQLVQSRTFVRDFVLKHYFTARGYDYISASRAKAKRLFSYSICSFSIFLFLSFICYTDIHESLFVFVFLVILFSFINFSICPALSAQSRSLLNFSCCCEYGAILFFFFWNFPV